MSQGCCGNRDAVVTQDATAYWDAALPWDAATNYEAALPWDAVATWDAAPPKMLLQHGMLHDLWVPSGCGEAGKKPCCPPKLTSLLSPHFPVDFIGGFDSYGYQAPQKTSHLQLQPLYT